MAARLSPYAAPLRETADQRFGKRLRAVIDRIIPADQDPGALDLGADSYVLAQLSAEAARLRPAIALGLDALDDLAMKRSGLPFDSVDASGRDALLAHIEGAPWFLGLCELTAEGFYADPANGGNRDALSWRMIGYEHRLPDGPSGRLLAEGKADEPTE